jgi:hypothetical protein
MIAYHTNGNVLLVKKLLGHKRIENSMKCIGMIQFKDDQYETTTATTVEEILKLGQAVGSNMTNCRSTQRLCTAIESQRGSATMSKASYHPLVGNTSRTLTIELYLSVD